MGRLLGFSRPWPGDERMQKKNNHIDGFLGSMDEDGSNVFLNWVKTNELKVGKGCWPQQVVVVEGGGGSQGVSQPAVAARGVGSQE
ncbi:hypothetical protein QJS10_CPA03g01666 [Acorus calamus]|uniref:Uncharacterized protein n=1 Tax=Acorus calamus TaxID=4465 RepID=A0AAV9F5M9_ACOCL|nr:hypothetical protein QJS10_CPA03g01666 [Acorus calamus]